MQDVIIALNKMSKYQSKCEKMGSLKKEKKKRITLQTNQSINHNGFCKAALAFLGLIKVIMISSPSSPIFFFFKDQLIYTTTTNITKYKNVWSFEGETYHSYQSTPQYLMNDLVSFHTNMSSNPPSISNIVIFW